MNVEGFARLAFEARYNAEHGEGGWEAWAAAGETERGEWMPVGSLIVGLIEGQSGGRLDPGKPSLSELEPPEVPARYALVEQMGFRHVTGTVRETEFCGRPMLEVTALDTGQTRLVGPDSLYQLTWLTREQAERAAHVPGIDMARAIAAPVPASYDTWDDRDDADRRANGEADSDPGDDL